jgi:hypothetical protein
MLVRAWKENKHFEHYRRTGHTGEPYGNARAHDPTGKHSRDANEHDPTSKYS